MTGPPPRSNHDHGRGTVGWQSLLHSISRIPKISFISILGPALLLIVGYFSWINYGARRLNTSLYGLQCENVTLTPQPSWIPSSVLEEVFKESELARLSVLDHQMSPALYDAFRVHPWIRRVIGIRKFAMAQVRVDVEYREPIAMVYCELADQAESGFQNTKSRPGTPVSSIVPNAQPIGNTKARFLPVDADGVLLRGQDFRSEQVPQYMLIYAKSAIPLGSAGSEFGDSRIKEALLLCRLLKDSREKLGLERIYVYPDPSSQGQSRWTLELTTREKKIQWGHPPGLESPGEPGFPAKLRKLNDFLLQPQSEEIAQKEIDLVTAAKSNLVNIRMQD